MSKIAKSVDKDLKNTTSDLKKDKKPKRLETFLFKRNHEFVMVPQDVVETLNITDAYHLGLLAHKAQMKCLWEDSFSTDSYVKNVKVVDGLEKSLKKLEEMYPSIRENFTKLDFVGMVKIGRC